MSVLKLLRSLPPEAAEQAGGLISRLSGHSAQLAAAREFAANYPASPAGALARLEELANKNGVGSTERAKLSARVVPGDRRRLRGHGFHGQH